MTSSLEINGKKLHSIKYAATHFGYSRDYVTRLAREQKIIAAQIGRQWFIDIDSLGSYSSTMALEQKVRQQQLSEERKRERQLTERIEKNEIERAHYKRRLAIRSKVVAAAVLLLGLTSGVAIERIPSVSVQLNRQVASAPFMQWFQGSANLELAPQPKENQPTPQGAEVVNFSHEAFRLSTMAEPTDGVLLLPAATSGTSSIDVKKLFSDDVRILKDENGQEYVAQVSEKGETIRKIAFVVVPVSTEKTP